MEYLILYSNNHTQPEHQWTLLTTEGKDAHPCLLALLFQGSLGLEAEATVWVQSWFAHGALASCHPVSSSLWLCVVDLRRIMSRFYVSYF